MEVLTLWLSPEDLVFAFACDFLSYFRMGLCGLDVSADQVEMGNMMYSNTSRIGVPSRCFHFLSNKPCPPLPSQVPQTRVSGREKRKKLLSGTNSNIEAFLHFPPPLLTSTTKFSPKPSKSLSADNWLHKSVIMKSMTYFLLGAGSDVAPTKV
jgi:hypothetical protein